MAARKHWRDASGTRSGAIPRPLAGPVANQHVANYQ